MRSSWCVMRQTSSGVGGTRTVKVARVLEGDIYAMKTIATEQSQRLKTLHNLAIGKAPSTHVPRPRRADRVSCKIPPERQQQKARRTPPPTPGLECALLSLNCNKLSPAIWVVKEFVPVSISPGTCPQSRKSCLDSTTSGCVSGRRS